MVSESLKSWATAAANAKDDSDDWSALMLGGDK